MQPFNQLTAIAAPIDEPNVDTNQLCPTRFNKLPRGLEYARVLFHDRRFEADGREKDFILNREPYRAAQIVVAYQLCVAGDRLAARYRESPKASMKDAPPPVATPPCSDPGPFVPPVVAEAKPLEAAGAHSPPATATAPPNSNATASELAGGIKK